MLLKAILKIILGGKNGHKGENILIKSDGRKIRLGAKTAVDINPGVSLLVKSIIS